MLSEEPELLAETGEPVKGNRSLADIEADIRALPLSLPAQEYRRRLEALDAEWRAENLRLFDVAVAYSTRRADEAMARLEGLEAAGGEET